MSVRKIFDAKIDEIAKSIDELCWENKDAYCQWLNQQYYLVQNSTRYLAMAASLVSLNDHEEFRWWAHHLREELDHDKTLLRDMKVLGWTDLQPVCPEVRAMVGAQYYDLQKNGQDALLGYALMLEGLSVKRCTVIAERVEKAHGKKATYLRLHADVDQGHYPEGIARVEQLSPERQATIVENLEMMGSLYLSFMKRMIESSQRGFNSKVA